MYLYKKNNDKSISVYNFFPNKTELIKFKKKYLEDIKSVILHINNEETKELLFDSRTIMFSALDRKENNGRISHIEETNDDTVISDYVNGKFDSLVPIGIIGTVPACKSIYSGNLNNQDSTLLFEGGCYKKQEFLSTESILLTGLLDSLQPLLSNHINNLIYPETLEYPDDEVMNFLKIFNCIKQCNISLENLRMLSEEGLISFNNNFNDMVEKSEIVINSYKKAIKKTR